MFNYVPFTYIKGPTYFSILVRLLLVVISKFADECLMCIH